MQEVASAEVYERDTTRRTRDEEQEIKRKKNGSRSKNTSRLLSVLWGLSIADFPHVHLEFIKYFEQHWLIMQEPKSQRITIGFICNIT